MAGNSDPPYSIPCTEDQVSMDTTCNTTENSKTADMPSHDSNVTLDNIKDVPEPLQSMAGDCERQYGDFGHYLCNTQGLSKTGDPIPLKVYARQVHEVNLKEIRITSISTIQDLIHEIRRFCEVKGEIAVYTRALINGNKSKLLDVRDIISTLKCSEFVYHVLGTKPDFSCIEKYSCQQNVVFVGAPTHGKSSTINSFAKSLGYPSTIAQTFQSTVRGTKVYTPYQIKLNGEGNTVFTIFDVPGATLTEIPTNEFETQMRYVLSGKQPPHADLGKGTRWFSREHEKIHALVCIQNGMADTDKMHASLIAAAKETSARDIPVFVIITHIDKMTEDAVKQKREDIRDKVGLDPSVIFQLANNDINDGGYPEDPQREHHVRSIVAQILLMSKTYKEQVGTSAACHVM